MNQLLLGALIPYLVAAAIYLRRGGRASLRFLIVTPAAMAAGALWAVAPDIPRLLGFDGLYHRLAQDPLTDIFLFHRTIDRIECDSPLYSVGIVILMAGLAMAALREMRLLEERNPPRPSATPSAFAKVSADKPRRGGSPRFEVGRR
jgi:hypothetical protein